MLLKGFDGHGEKPMRCLFFAPVQGSNPSWISFRGFADADLI